MKLPNLTKKQKIIIFSLLGVAALIAFISVIIVARIAKPSNSEENAEDLSATTVLEILPGDPITKVEEEEEPEPEEEPATPAPISRPASSGSGVCPTTFGILMLINPNFKVSESWIASRRAQLIDITANYGIKEGNAYNGTPLMDAEAARHLNDMLSDYTEETGGEITTRSCFRSYGTSCGRLCYPTGTSDHHTGYTCDLIDDQYGNSLDTSTYSSHPEWQWLRKNSYKYGFIDRFPYAWSGGPMSEPVNVNAEGSTGLYETWHYRYVGITAATEIATGKYNDGEYDSLEHYLKATGKITNLLGPADCD